jgi:Sulfotransferase family
MQVFVLGMHRSGTSGVTRLLNMAGAYFGPEGISNGADEGNLKGFWERVDVRSACDGLLQESGFDWWKVADFSLDRISEPVRARYVDSLKRILLELDAHRPWVVKEPRLSLLFPLIRPLLEVPVCVHVTREPLEVADSLQTRNAFPAPAGLALWELYTIRAFEASAGLPRVLVRYEDLMSTPVATLARLLEQLNELGTFGLRLPTEREITAYIDPHLHREHRSPSDRRMWMNEQQMSIAAAIDNGTVSDEGVVPHELSAGARAQLRAFEEDRARRGRADQLQNEVDQRQDEIKGLQKRLDALEEAAIATDDRIADVRRLLDRADRQMQLLSKSRTWRWAWSAHAARLRVLGADKEPVSDPLERALSAVEQARQGLTEPVSQATIPDPEDDGRP